MGKLTDSETSVYFDDKHVLGKGQPASLVDAACQQLHNGYKCAIMDEELAGNECTPWEVTYKSASYLGEAQLAPKCEEFNGGDNCAAKACKIEGYRV